MDDAKLAVRRRLYEDFGFYAEAALKIRTKPPNARIVPLTLNRAQLHLLSVITRQMETQGFVRVVILKGRQMGLSTMVGGWFYWWVTQREAQKAIVMAHKKEAAYSLFDMTKRYHKEIPDVLRPHTEKSNRKELVFDKLDSSYLVDSAQGDGVARGETLTVAHLSELAHWPKTSARETFSGLMDAVPLAEGTAVLIESTANGMGDLFHEQWRAAASGESSFETVFCPWFWADEYRLPVPTNFSRTPDEDALVAAFGLDNEQLEFRRKRIGEKGLDLFRQEYPNTPEEAFLTSGRPVFNLDTIHDMLLRVRDPLLRQTLMPNGEGTMEWEDSKLGELHHMLPFDPKETYYIGADVGFGVRKDYSVAQVFNSKRQQAAVWRSDRFDNDHFGTVLAHLGRLFNDAFICCESNGPGGLTNRVLTKDEGYRNYYTETVYDRVSDVERTQIGFSTTAKSKPFVIGKLRANLRRGEIEIYDKLTLEEMRSFVVSETGKMEAEAGQHDDHVMSLALADHVNEGSFTPIENQDGWYVTGDY